MSQSQLTDPRRRLLALMGIPPEETAFDYYRLLGLDPFEENADAIKAQVERRTRMLTMHRTGPYSKASNDLLYEVNSAKTCLLNPRLKEAYDRRLRDDLARKGWGVAPDDHLLRRSQTASDHPPAASAGKAPPEPNPPLTPAAPQTKTDPKDDLSAIEKLLSNVEISQQDLQLGTDPGDELDLVLDGDLDLFDHLDDAANNGSPTPDDVFPFPIGDDGEGANHDSSAAIESPGQKIAPQEQAAVRDGSPPQPQKAIQKTGKQKPRAGEAPRTPQAEEAPPPPPRKPVAPPAAAKTPRPSTKSAGAKAAVPSVRQQGRAAAGAEAWIPEDAGYELVGDEPSPDGHAKSAAPAESPAAAEEAEESPPFASDGGQSRSRLVVGALAASLLAVAGYAYWSGWLLPRGPAALEPPPQFARRAPLPPDPAGELTLPADFQQPVSPAVADGVVSIGVAYSSEKHFWLEWAVREFALSEAGRKVRVELVPLGSLEAVAAIVRGDRQLHVWAPASSVFRETFVRDWLGKHGAEPGAAANPIAREEVLAVTPMVLVMWKSRYQALAARSPEVSLETIGAAMRAESGWGELGGKPEWGRFKFRHAHPARSNCGLMTLVVLAASYHNKTSALSMEDVMAPGLQEHLSWFSGGVAGLAAATGDLMKDMILMGPSVADAVLVYESSAIDYLQKAEGRWEPLQVIYVEPNVWNDNPCYLLDVPWSAPTQRQAAAAFVDFLISDAAQAQALEHGFRPGNPSVPVKSLHTPFVRFAEYGVRVDLPEACELPSRAVIENLQQSWLRNAAPR